jgi:ABC-type antimicrobial peptide transport system permease subunit
VRAVNPDAESVPVNAMFLRPAGGVSDEELVSRVNAAAPDADAVTRQEAADTAPGVGQVRQSFRIIFILFGLVVPLVTGLFFLIVTLQKSRTLTLLRAIGARTSVLAVALLLQVFVVTASGVVIGAVGYRLVTGIEVGSLTLRFDGRALATWTGVFLVLAVVGALASLRRVLRVDPLEAAAGGVR